MSLPFLRRPSAGAAVPPPAPDDDPLARAHAAFVANRDRNLFFGVYPSWALAAQAAAAYGAAGYDNAASAQLYRHRVRMDVHDYPVLAWLLRSMVEGHRRVLDVGGATGIKWLAFREALAPWPDLHWCVQDVPAMVAEGRRLAAERAVAAGPGAPPERLAFTERLADGAGCDVLLASGVVQYLPQPLGELLADWPRDALPRRIVVNTAALHPTHGYVTVNSLGTAFCPYRVQTQAELVAPLAALGYRPRDAWANPGKALELPGHPELSLSAYSGLCLDRMPG